MNLSLQPHPLQAHWIPGFAFLAIILLSAFNWNYNYLTQVLAGTPQTAVFGGLILAVTAFVIGEILDSLRDILESVTESALDKYGKKKWILFGDHWNNFVLHATEQQARMFKDHYFRYYVVSANLTLGLLLIGASGLIGNLSISCLTWISLSIPWRAWFIMVCALLILGGDAFLLRKGMKDVLDEWAKNQPWTNRNPYSK